MVNSLAHIRLRWHRICDLSANSQSLLSSRVILESLNDDWALEQLLVKFDIVSADHKWFDSELVWKLVFLEIDRGFGRFVANSKFFRLITVF